MKNFLLFISFFALIVTCRAQQATNADGWISLFDGKSLNDWKVGENASTFSVKGWCDCGEWACGTSFL
jgi:hypothetical protein